MLAASLTLRSAYSRSIGGKASFQEIGSEFTIRKYTTSRPGCETDWKFVRYVLVLPETWVLSTTLNL